MPAVHVVAAPVVPALPREHAVLDDIRGVARGIPDCQRYVALLARVSDQLEQVVALYELPAEREAYRRRPVVTRHHVGARRHRAGGLD